MSAEKDRNELLDPRNPNSPYNKYNWDSPYSISNPISPNYNPSAAAISFLTGVVIFLVVGGLVGSAIVIALLEKYVPGYGGNVLFAAALGIGLILYFFCVSRDYTKNPLTKDEIRDKWVMTRIAGPLMVLILLGCEVSCWFSGESMFLFILRCVIYGPPHK